MASDIVRRRSSVLQTTKSKDLLRVVAKASGKAEVNEAHEGEALAMYPVMRDALPLYTELGPYQRVRLVKTIRYSGTNSATHQAFVGACRELGSERTRMYVRSSGGERDADGNPDLTLTTGWETLVRSGGPLNVGTTAPMCCFEIEEGSLGYRDLAYRRDLFERAVAAMGCSDTVKFEFIDGALAVKAIDEWRVLVNRADPGDRNPCAIYIFGFADIFSATEAGERVLDQIFRRLDEHSLVTVSSEKEVYESLRKPFNELIEGWEVSVLGNLTEDAAAVLAGRLPNRETLPSRIPSFWRVKEGNQPERLIGELVAVDEGYALELSSLDVTPEQLEACIEAVEGRAPKKKSTTKSQGSDRSIPRSAGQASQAKRGKASEATDRIDLITKGADGRLNLVVVDSGEIVDVNERQAWLVAKFKAYVSYCLSPSFKEKHPGVALESVQFLVACATPPTPAMLAIEGVATRGRKSVTIPVVYQAS